jgi:hypothetical protein
MGATTSSTSIKRVLMRPNLNIHGREEHFPLSSDKPYHSPAILSGFCWQRGPLVGKAKAQRGLGASHNGCVIYGGQSRSRSHVLVLIWAHIGSTCAGHGLRRSYHVVVSKQLSTMALVSPRSLPIWMKVLTRFSTSRSISSSRSLYLQCIMHNTYHLCVMSGQSRLSSTYMFRVYLYWRTSTFSNE